MLHVRIDDREIQVTPGTTVLEAAEALGIEIPTLCFLQGYAPSTSCQVCLVKDCRSQKLVPACATQVVDGMEVESESDEVRDVRRTALELLLSDHVGDCLAPCFFACPAHMDIPLMLQQIGDEHLQSAIETVKREIALPAVLGRVCTKPCEKGCRRNASDDPVAVCELKRYVADRDLALDEPYRPACRPATGQRVAIVGAGPTGLSAAFYLRQQGHECVIYEREEMPGGRLRDEVSAGNLPADVLDAEIAQIFRLGIEWLPGRELMDKASIDRLAAESDAVLIACGQLTRDQVQQWGLPPGPRGIQVNRETYETGIPKLFAAGNAVRAKGLPVRSVADGKEAAIAIGQFLAGEPVRGPGKPFALRIGRVAADEMPQFLEGFGQAERAEPEGGTEFSLPQATDQSHRCLACGCPAHGSCRLERYAALYQADSSRFASERRPFERFGRHASVMFEPGKCIKCELCVQIAERAQAPLGLSFVGRGFDVRLAVPVDGSFDEGLAQVAQECVAACPTAALYFDHHEAHDVNQVVQIEPLAHQGHGRND